MRATHESRAVTAQEELCRTAPTEQLGGCVNEMVGVQKQVSVPFALTYVSGTQTDEEGDGLSIDFQSHLYFR